MSTSTLSGAKTKKAKKKAEIEIKKLELKFERKRRNHDGQMRQLEDKLQIKMLEGEREIFSGSSLTDRIPLPSRSRNLKSTQRQQGALNLTNRKSMQKTCEYFCPGKTCFGRKNS